MTKITMPNDPNINLFLRVIFFIFSYPLSYPLN